MFYKVRNGIRKKEPNNIRQTYPSLGKSGQT